MSLKTKKISEYFFWNLQTFLVELYNQYWSWNSLVLGIFVRLEFGEQNFGDVLKNVCHFLKTVAEDVAKGFTKVTNHS